MDNNFSYYAHSTILKTMVKYTITSVNNEKIKYDNLLKNNKDRYERQEFLVEGYHLVEECFKAGLLKRLYIINELDAQKYNDIDSIKVTPEIIKKLSSTLSPEGIIGVSRLIKEREVGEKVLYLDGVQDPGNVGTLLRSALGFNFSSVILGPHCASLYSDKTLRSTQGALFHLNVIEDKKDTYLIELKNKGYQLIGADIKDAVNIKEASISTPLCLVLGSEGQGLRLTTKALLTQKVFIPMNKDLESLNVSIAGSIIMYHFMDK